MFKSSTKIIITIVIVSLAVVAMFIKPKSKGLPVVAIANYGAHTSLQDTIDGIQEKLQGVVQFEVADVNFEHTLILQMLHKLMTHKPIVIVTMGTPITQVAKSFIKETPIIFADVTDPVEVGVLKHHDQPELNITGVSDRQDLNVFIEFAKKLLPHAKNIGLLYSTSDANDAVLVKMMEHSAKLHGMEVVAISVEHARDIPLRMHLLDGKVDLIYVGTSGPIQPSLPTIVAEADRMKIPVFNAHEDAVLKHYALGSCGVNYRRLGYHVAAVIERILHGQPIKNIQPIYPTATLGDFQGFISQKKAREFGVNLPADLNNITIVE